MSQALSSNFFRRPVIDVSLDLIGKFLVYKKNNKTLSLQITEVEAYDGPFDLASHARFGKTSRNGAMFYAGGVYYLYCVYGMYWMLNVVAGEEDYPSAILIRSAGHINGPGKLTEKLGLDKTFDKKDISQETSLWIEDRGVFVGEKDIVKTHRIGVEYAGPEWANKKYRFCLKTESTIKKEEVCL